VLLRRDWLSAIVVLMVAELAQTDGGSRETLVGLAIAFTGVLVIVIRFRFLPMVAALAVSVLAGFLIVNDFSVWYAASTILGLFIMLALTAYPFRTAVANRKLFNANFLAPD
jgi:hypothetical protein